MSGFLFLLPLWLWSKVTTVFAAFVTVLRSAAP
jgi:hypothetical protein